MSIENFGGNLTMACDECGAELADSYGRDEFQEMVDRAKREGWRITHLGGGHWSHACVSCARSARAKDDFD